MRLVCVLLLADILNEEASQGISSGITRVYSVAFSVEIAMTTLMQEIFLQEPNCDNQ